MITLTEANALLVHKAFYKKELIIDGVEVTIFNYRIADKEAFRAPKAVELRGLTFVGNKPFLSMPKFFNVNEIPENEIKHLKYKKIKKVQDKLDGSLIQPVSINGDIRMKTKGSFDNIQSELAQYEVETDPDLEYFILDCWDNNFYPLFELIGPSNKIVLKYPENKLVLIAVRTAEGDFIDIDKFKYPNKAKSFDKTLDEMLHDAKNVKDIEGYVIKFTDGSLVKIKTLDYLEKHRVQDELSSNKVILKRVLDEDLDDIYSLLEDEDQINAFKKTEKAIQDYLLSFILEIQSITKQTPVNKKLFVQKYLKHPWFSVIMEALKGKDIKESLVKHIQHKYRKEGLATVFLKEINAI